MRLWHKDLINVLPRQQLISQWRECCCIAQNLANKGTPNHILVNRILEFPKCHFNYYAELVVQEIRNRGYNVSLITYNKFKENLEQARTNTEFTNSLNNDIDFILFEGWHNHIYLRQCLYNLEEKAISGGITQEEWNKIYYKFCNFTPLQDIVDLICVSPNRDIDFTEIERNDL